METILTYNVKVTHNTKISYIKLQINNEEISNIKNIKKYMAGPKNLVLNPFLV